jgi:hypothetical protein
MGPLFGVLAFLALLALLALIVGGKCELLACGKSRFIFKHKTITMEK